MTRDPMHTASKKEMAQCIPDINYCLRSEVSITLRCQLCSTLYTAVRISDCSKSTSAIKVASMKKTDDFCYKRKSSCATAKSTPFTVSKDEWDTKKDTGKSMKNVCGMPKGTSRAKATLNSEKNLACSMLAGLRCAVRCTVKVHSLF